MKGSFLPTQKFAGSPPSAAVKNALARGMEFHRGGRLAEAAQCYENALRSDPRNSDVLHLLGLVRASEGDLDRGTELIKKAVAIQPRFAAAFFNLGNLLRKQDRPVEAVSAYKRAIALQPKFPEAHCNLGCTLESLGQLEEAADSLNRAISNQPTYAEAHRNLGIVRNKQGALGQAVACLRRALKLNPAHVSAHYELGLALQAQGNTREAIIALKHATSLGHRDPCVWLNLGECLHGEGQFAEAEAACRQAITLHSDFTEALRLLGKNIDINLWTEHLWRTQREALEKNSDCVAIFELLGSSLFLQGKLGEALSIWRQTTPLISLKHPGLRAEKNASATIRRHTVALETPHHRLSLDIQIIILVGDSSVTLCAPALSWIGQASHIENVLHLLETEILRRVAGANPSLTRVFLGHSSAGDSKPSIVETIQDEASHLRLFAQHLSSIQCWRETWECLRLANDLSPLPRHFLSFLGMLSAIYESIDAGIGLYVEATQRRLKETDAAIFWERSRFVAIPALLEQASTALHTGSFTPFPSSSGTTETLPVIRAPRIGEETGSSTIPIEFLRIEACNYLAEALINHHNALPLARAVYLRRDQYQQDWLRSYGINHVDTLFLGIDWVRNIGHIAFLGHLVKMRELGFAPWRHIVVLAEDRYIANRAYLDQWRRHITVVTDPELVAHFGPLTIACGFRFSALFRFPNREPLYNSELAAAVEEKWEESARSCLLTLSPDFKAAGWQALAPFGPKPGDWFVCLHVRESGFHALSDEPRNAGICDYLPAIEAITRRGGWVIRLGDPTMSRLPSMDRVIDYPHTQLKSPAMDVFLCAETRFFIGVHSGLSHVPNSFGRPSVMTNWLNTGSLPPFPRNSLFLPKMIRRTNDDQLLPFRETLGEEWGLRCYGDCRIEEFGTTLVNNTAEEITEVVVEMLDRIDGVHQSSPDDAELHKKFFALFSNRSPGGLACLGTAFLRRHRELL